LLLLRHLLKAHKTRKNRTLKASQPSQWQRKWESKQSG